MKLRRLHDARLHGHPRLLFLLVTHALNKYLQTFFFGPPAKMTTNNFLYFLYLWLIKSSSVSHTLTDTQIPNKVVASCNHQLLATSSCLARLSWFTHL